MITDLAQHLSDVAAEVVSPAGSGWMPWYVENLVEARAAEIALLIDEDGIDLKIGDLTGAEYAGWLIHESDSMRGDLEPGERAGYLARQIVEHDDNHVVPVDREQALREVLIAVLEAARASILYQAAEERSQDPIAVIRRAVDEHLVKSGKGAAVQRYTTGKVTP